MLITVWQQFTDRIFRWTDRFAMLPNWQWLLILLMPVAALFFSFPSYDLLNSEFEKCYDALFRQAEFPLAQFNYGEGSHESKLAFRLFLPLLIRFLGIESFWGVLAIQAVVGILTMGLVVCLIHRLSFGDHRVVIILSLAFVFIAAGRAALVDIRGYVYEGECVLFLLAALYSRNPLAIFLFITCCSWSDERGLIASSLVFLFYLFEKPPRRNMAVLISIIAAWIAYFAVRFYLAKTYALKTGSEGISMRIFTDNFNILPLSVWTGLEGFWILAVPALWVTWKNNKAEFALLTGNILFIIFIAQCVMDITRSMVYLVPVIFYALRTVSQSEEKAAIQKLSLYVLIFCLLFPAYYCAGGYLMVWQYPFPLQVLRILFAG